MINDMQEVIDTYDQLLKFEDYLTITLPEIEIFESGNNNFKMCCPIHGETVPSFLYNDRLGHWTCFGACSTSGKTVKFHHMWLQKQYGEHIAMVQSIKHLQGLFAHLLPRWDPNQERSITKKEISVENAMADFYTEIKIIDDRKHFNNLIIQRFIK